MRKSCTIFARLFAGATFLASAAFAHAEGTVVVYSAAPQQLMDELLPMSKPGPASS
jgi:iron(III) transport system substrate-binding protein